MRPTQILNLVLLVIAAGWVVLEIQKGKLTGRKRVWAVLLIGLFAVGWVARQFDW